MTNWNSIEELRQIFIDKYTNSKLTTELEKACSEEYELMRDYNGRQILELLQNVDDACTDDDNKSEIYIKYKDNILEVGNTGTVFTFDTIERLCLGRASNKSSTNIGNKGTGFRSLINDAEWIEIHSGNFSIRFSEKYTKELFKKYADRDSSLYCELISNQLREWKKDYPLCFPILNCPEEIEKIHTHFDTLIRVKIKENNSSKTTSIENQLNLPFYKSILFLPNITKIVIESNNSKREYEKCFDSKGNYDDVLIQENEDSLEHYYLFNKHVEISSEKFADLIIAYPTDENYDFSKEKLYCYFPIRNFQTPIHALIHAPFLTNSSRDDVPNDTEQINYSIFKQVAIFIKEAAEILKNLIQANPIEFVTPINFSSNKMWDDDSFNLKDLYLKLLCDSKIIPTVNNEYISINDNPKLLKDNYPNEFKGEGFEQLVKSGLNQDVYNFIRALCEKFKINYSLEPQNLANAINIHSNEYSIDSSITIFMWWSKFYRNSIVLPNLLKDTNENWIQKDFKVFLPTNDGISVLDSSLSWVKLCVLKQEYVTKLIEIIKSNYLNEWERIGNKYSAERINEKRLLDAFSDVNLAVNFTEQSSSRVIISEITNQIDNDKKAISFMNWFYENYKNKMAADSELAKLKFKLLDNNGNIVDTKNLYFGADYSNNLADKLFSNTEYRPICSLEKIYNGSEKDGFIEFIKLCGVLTYPKCKKVYLNELDDKNEFIRFIKEKYSLSFNINYLETYSIDNFRNLLLELETKESVDLLTNDTSLSSLILSTEKLSSARQQSNWTPSSFNANEYVLFELNTTKWIEIDGSKYSPKEIIKYSKLKDKLDSLYGITEKDLINLLSEDIVKRYNLSFKNDFSECPDAQILDIIHKLPEKDKTGEISRKLYIDLIKNKKDKEPNYEPLNLNLIAKDGNFYPNNELVYVDKSIPQTIPNDKKLDIPIQQSTETIKKWLGVNKVELNLKMTKHIPFDDFASFNEELKDLKVCILSILEESTTNYINKIQRIKVIPCIDICALESNSNSSIGMKNYSFIRNDGIFYFKLPNDNLDTFRNNHEYATTIIEMFKEAVSPQIPIDLAELLISKNHKEKKQIIEEKFGIDKWNSSYELLFEKSNLTKMVQEFFEKNNLPKEMIERICNIDFSSELLDEDYALIFKSLDIIQKDICDLNDIHSTIKIDVKEYIKGQCTNYLNSHRESYRKNCYLNLLRFPNQQQKFLSMISDYDNYDFSDCKINNSIIFSPVDLIKAAFPLFDEKIENNIDIDSNYNKNYNKCLNNDGIEQSDFDYFIEDNNQTKSLLYFDSYESVVKMFLSSKDNEQLDSSSKDEKTSDDIDTSTITTELVSTNNDGKKKSHHKGEYGDKKTKEINDGNEKAGREAETIAYEELKKTNPSLIWNSKYSTIPAAKNNQPPSNVVCDMWVHSNDRNIYFEIKSSTTEFEMSINEYESMKNNKENYFVVLVNRDTKEISKHKFDELDSFKEPSKYKFTFKQIEIK